LPIASYFPGTNKQTVMDGAAVLDMQPLLFSFPVNFGFFEFYNVFCTLREASRIIVSSLPCIMVSKNALAHMLGDACSFFTSAVGFEACFCVVWKGFDIE